MCVFAVKMTSKQITSMNFLPFATARAKRLSNVGVPAGFSRASGKSTPVPSGEFNTTADRAC